MKSLKMDKKLEILSEISQLLHEEADCGYDKLCCKFEVEGDSVVTEFEFMKNGKVTNRAISLENRFKNMGLILSLRKEMKDKTGGEWIQFTLKINEEGNANTYFKYAK